MDLGIFPFGQPDLLQCGLRGKNHFISSKNDGIFIRPSFFKEGISFPPEVFNLLLILFDINPARLVIGKFDLFENEVIAGSGFVGYTIGEPNVLLQPLDRPVGIGVTKIFKRVGVFENPFEFFYLPIGQPRFGPALIEKAL